MKVQFVKDEYACINTQGLRLVKKEDSHYGDMKRFNIELFYRGQDVTIRYESDKKSRDAMFEMLAKAVAAQEAK